MNFLTRFFKKPVKPNIGCLCDCNGDIQMTNTYDVEYFPLGSDHHTAFIIGKCEKCGGLAGFPRSNLELAVKDGTEEGKKILQENFGLMIF